MARKNGNGTDGAEAGNGQGKNLSEQGSDYVKRVENLHRELASEKSSYMAACKSLREGIKEVLTEAAEAGITRKTIKTAVKVRELERKAEEAREDLDIAERDHLDNIRLALGDLSELPLGKAALGETEAAAAA